MQKSIVGTFYSGKACVKYEVYFSLRSVEKPLSVARRNVRSVEQCLRTYRGTVKSVNGACKCFSGIIILLNLR